MKGLLSFDGGSRGNPGPAACAFVIKDASGRTLDSGSALLGDATNNQAEYEGLIRGLARAAELGISELSVSGDSELVIRQMQGRYKVRSALLKPLHRRASEIAGRFRSVSFRHVPRGENSEADALLNRALDRNAPS